MRERSIVKSAQRATPLEVEYTPDQKLTKLPKSEVGVTSTFSATDSTMTTTTTTLKRATSSAPLLVSPSVSPITPSVNVNTFTFTPILLSGKKTSVAPGKSSFVVESKDSQSSSSEKASVPRSPPLPFESPIATTDKLLTATESSESILTSEASSIISSSSADRIAGELLLPKSNSKQNVEKREKEVAVVKPRKQRRRSSPVEATASSSSTCGQVIAG